METPEFRNFVLQRSPNSIAAQLLRDFAPAVDPTSGFRDLGSPAPGANVIGPADGIMDVGTAFFVPEGWRRGNQFNVRADYELRPGKDRLYGNFYRTNSYAVTGGIRPAFNRPTPNTTHFGNINYTHTFSSSKLNEFRAGVMRLVGLPDVPQHLEIPGITITRRHRVRAVRLSERLVADELALQEHLHGGASSHQLKMGGELRQMYGSATNTTNYIPAYQFSSLLNFANDEALQMTRYVDPRSGEPVTAYSELTQTEWAVFIDDDWKLDAQPDHQRGPAVRELRHVQGQRRHASQSGVRPRRDLRRSGWPRHASISSTGSIRPTTTTSGRGSDSRGIPRATARWRCAAATASPTIG